MLNQLTDPPRGSIIMHLCWTDQITGNCYQWKHAEKQKTSYGLSILIVMEWFCFSTNFSHWNGNGAMPTSWHQPSMLLWWCSRKIWTAWMAIWMFSGWHDTKNDHVLPIFRCWMDIPRFTPACTYFLQDGDKLRWGTKCVLLYPGTHLVVYTEFSVKARLTGCILLEYREFRDSEDSMYIAQGYCKEIEIPDLTLRTGIWPGVSAWTVLKTPFFLVNIQTLGFQAVFCTERSLCNHNCLFLFCLHQNKSGPAEEMSFLWLQLLFVCCLSWKPFQST